jgi:hypothetical protein
MSLRQIEYKGRWVSINATTGAEGGWTYQIDDGPIRRLASPRPLSNEEGLFREAEDAAKAEIDRAESLLGG